MDFGVRFGVEDGEMSRSLRNVIQHLLNLTNGRIASKKPREFRKQNPPLNAGTNSLIQKTFLKEDRTLYKTQLTQEL